MPPRRSVVELMVLMLTGTVCASIVLAGAAIAVVEIVSPATDTAALMASLSSAVGVLLGAVLGLLAGRSERGAALHRKPGGGTDEL